MKKVKQVKTSWESKPVCRSDSDKVITITTSPPPTTTTTTWAEPPEGTDDIPYSVPSVWPTGDISIPSVWPTLEDDFDGKIREGLSFDDVLIVPKYSEVISRADPDISSELTMQDNRKEYTLKVPVLSAPMYHISGDRMSSALDEIGALCVIHRFCTIKEQCEFVDKSIAKIKAAAIGMSGDYYERACELVKHGVNILCIEVAQAHHILARKAIERIKSNFPDIMLICGNVSTYDGTYYLAESGSDLIKIGTGSGNNCDTNLVTSCGMPQLSAIIESSRAKRDYEHKTEKGVGLISDGGIKTPGNAGVALGLGCSAIMAGFLLAATEETPTDIISSPERPFQLYKKYAGSASYEIKKKFGQNKKKVDIAEGSEILVPFRGSVKNIVEEFAAGLRTVLSYNGSHNLDEFRKNMELIRKPYIRRDRNFI